MPLRPPPLYIHTAGLQGRHQPSGHPRASFYDYRPSVPWLPRQKRLTHYLSSLTGAASHKIADHTNWLGNTGELINEEVHSTASFFATVTSSSESQYPDCRNSSRSGPTVPISPLSFPSSSKPISPMTATPNFFAARLPA